MDFFVLSVMVWSTIGMSMTVPLAVHSDPIKIDYSVCQPAEYGPLQGLPSKFLECCPPLPTKPIIDGLPPPLSSVTRVRKAAQCNNDEAYAEKLAKGYALMRALPDDDPRSLFQQWRSHCSHCGGAFITTNKTSKVAMGIDIHFNWLFLPWHRFYVYFQERILQSLLDDPTFSFSFWNWDNPYTVEDKSSKEDACLKVGHYFPKMYSHPNFASFDPNRSAGAMSKARLNFPDLTYIFTFTSAGQPLANVSADELIASNMNVMYQAMVRGGSTSETFLGQVYRAGDHQAISPLHGGSLEFSAHSSVHSWIGLDNPLFYDMGDLSVAGKDPVFFAHHSNIDRLWQVWRDIGPLVGAKHEDFTDPDFLNAEFLFYDENKDLRRVTVKESLDLSNFGYTYQKANDAAWIYANPPRCSNMTYAQLLTQAGSLSMPIPDSNGTYHLQAGVPFVMVVDRPVNPHGHEEFLEIGGIKLDRTKYAGFDVFVDLINPRNLTNPWKCAEYSGRFTSTAIGRHAVEGAKLFEWKQSITRTLVDIHPDHAPPPPSKIVVTLLPMSRPGHKESITFTSITVITSK